MPLAFAHQPFAALQFAAFDVETTGLDASSDRVVEVAVVRCLSDGQALATYDTLVNPRCSVGPAGVHGITDEAVQGAPTFGEIAPRLTAALSGAVAVAHNAVFDVSFVMAEQARLGVEAPFPYICTKELRAVVGLGERWLSLSAACREAGIGTHNAHSALDDARATAQLLAAYLRRARSMGAATLTDLLTLNREIPTPIFAYSWKHELLAAPPYHSLLFTRLPRS